MKLSSLPALVLCGLLFSACREPGHGHGDADSEDADVVADAHDDGGTEDAGDADEISEDADQPVDADEELETHYCDISNGDDVNECDECLPADIDEAVQAAMAIMFPNADQVSMVGTGAESYFVAELASETLGYAFLSNAYGFEGQLTTLAGVDVEGWSIRVELTMSHPYEWTYMLSDWFYEQFRCLDVSQIDLDGGDWDPYEVDAVTSATTTSHAVIETVWQSFQRYEQIASGE